MLRGTAAEAERILQDAVAKLDDPLHLRCTSSPGGAAGLPLGPSPLPGRVLGNPERQEAEQQGTGDPRQAPPLTVSPLLADYLVSRAQAALDAVSALEKGHAQYLVSRSGKCGGRGQKWAEAAGPGCPVCWPQLPPATGEFSRAVPPPHPPGACPARSAGLGSLSCGCCLAA